MNFFLENALSLCKCLSLAILKIAKAVGSPDYFTYFIKFY